MEVEMSNRIALLLAVLCACAADGVVSTAAAQARSSDAGQWEVPRTPDGHPDLQGNWTNVTLTPFEREEGRGPVFTSEEVDAIERPPGQTDGCPPNPGTLACGRVFAQSADAGSNELGEPPAATTSRADTHGKTNSDGGKSKDRPIPI